MIANVDEECGIFQGIMLDLLVRSKIFRAQECLLVGKQPDQLVIQSIAQGYLVAQVAEFRKFFDSNRRGQSYDLATLVTVANDTKLQERYDELKFKWEQEYKDLADKIFFHRDRTYIASSGRDRGAIETFIDELNEFLDLVTTSLTTAGYSVGHLVRDRNGTFLMDVESAAIETFRLMN